MKTIFTFMLMLLCMSGIAQDKIYVHTATAANSAGNVTYIDHPDLNGNPNAGIVFVHSWNPNGLPAAYNNHPTGLWYDGAQWAIFNEDLDPIVEGSHYMVYIAADPNDVITHVSDAGNQGTFGDYTTVIDDPNLNGSNPGPYAIMSHYWNPNSVYNIENFGFYYDDTLGKRGIYDENGDPIPTGAAFKILVDGDGSFYFTHTATGSSYITVIDNPALNGNPDATFVFTHYWGVNGAPSEVNIDANLSSYYNGSNWCIYSEDTSTEIVAGTAFDIIVAPLDVLNVGDEQMPTVSVSMYPNPAATTVNFKASENIDTITLYNILGQKVLSQMGNSTQMQMDVASLTTGSYFAMVAADGHTQTLQLIKE